MRMDGQGRIAILTPRYAPAIGGVERVAEMQARELQRRGARVEVLTTDPSGRLPRVELRDGVLVRRFPTLANDGVYFLAPLLGRWLARHAHAFALLHAHSYHTPIALQAALASRSATIPLVVTPHYHGTGHSRLRRWLHVPYRPLGQWMLQQAARVLCVSQVEEQLLQRHFGGRLRTMVVPNGVDVDELSAACGTARRASGDAPLHVLSVGRLDAYKRTDRLVDAVAHLPIGARLRLVGDGPQRATLERQVATLGLGERVQFDGQLSRPALLEAYASADVFASLSEHESFGLAVLEAAVAGLPVLASDIAAHREVAGYLPSGRTSFVSPAAPPDAIAGLLVSMAARGRATSVQHWPLPTWSAHVDRTVACYADAIARQRPEVAA